MNKFFVVLVVLVFIIFSGQLHAQVAVFDAGVSSLIEAMQIDQIIYYGQMVYQLIEQATLLGEQVKNSYEIAKRTVQNLQSAGDIKNLDDFKRWYNRQLYLENRTMETIENWNVRIGGKSYSVYDVEGMADGLNDTYVEYWDQQFTEMQRRAMWLQLGLTPSNYVYRQTFKDKLRNLQREFLAAAEIQNEEYMENVGRGNEIMEKLANDKNLDTDEKMGEKEVLMYIAESIITSNKLMGNVLMNQAKMMEMESLKLYNDQTPVDAPILSDWPEDGFRPLKSSTSP